MGAVLGAVSPAVVVPRMVQLMDEKYGTEKGIPQMILAGASLDDVFVIVLFTAFVRMAQGNVVQVMDFLNIPISIVLGILLGALVGFALAWFFEFCFKKNHPIRNSIKVIIVLGFAFLLLAIDMVGGYRVRIRTARNHVWHLCLQCEVQKSLGMLPRGLKLPPFFFYG